MDDEAIYSDELCGGRCDDCAELSYPAAHLCMSCLGSSISEVPLSTSGRLYAFSTIHVGPAQFPRPYTVGYADLPEGLRLFGRVRAATELGSRVAITRDEIGKDGEGNPIAGICFVPLPELAA